MESLRSHMVDMEGTQRLAVSRSSCHLKLEGLKGVYQRPEAEITKWKLEMRCICSEAIRAIGIDTTTREDGSRCKERMEKHPSFFLLSAHGLTGITHWSNLARNQLTRDTGEYSFPVTVTLQNGAEHGRAMEHTWDQQAKN